MTDIDDGPINLDDDEVDRYLHNESIPDGGLSYAELEDRTRFIEKITSGIGPYNAGIAIGWTPYKINQLLADPDFVAIIDVAEARKDESVEMALYRQASSGNIPAIQMWLHARRPERWIATKKLSIESSEKVEVSIIHSIRDAARLLLQENGPAALQQGGALDIIDAEVVGGD